MQVRSSRIVLASNAAMLVVAGLFIAGCVTGCADAPAAPITGLSEEQQTAGSRFAAQYEAIQFQTTLSADCLREINNSDCTLLVPHDWVQTSPSHFELRGSDDGTNFPHTIKVIEHSSDGGTLEATLDRFTQTAHAMIEGYVEQGRWSATIDSHPAVVVQYGHVEESVFPGAKGVTRAYFTVKHDRYDRRQMRTFIISCTAPADAFETVMPLFDEVASRAVLFRSGS